MKHIDKYIKDCTEAIESVDNGLGKIQTKALRHLAQVIRADLEEITKSKEQEQ